MKGYVLIIIMIFCSCQLTVKGQYDVAFNHFWMMEPQFNPGAVGTTPNLRINGCYSNQMSGYTNNPKTMFIGADLPFHRRWSR